MVVIIHLTLQLKEGYAMTTRWTTCFAVLRTLATHRVTYRFLGLLLVSLGVAQGGPLVEGFGDVVCVLLGGCVG